MGDQPRRNRRQGREEADKQNEDQGPHCQGHEKRFSVHCRKRQIGQAGSAQTRGTQEGLKFSSDVSLECGRQCRPRRLRMTRSACWIRRRRGSVLSHRNQRPSLSALWRSDRRLFLAQRRSTVLRRVGRGKVTSFHQPGRAQSVLDNRLDLGSSAIARGCGRPFGKSFCLGALAALEGGCESPGPCDFYG